MPNRLTRDQILIRALDMVDSPSLDTKDRPAGTIISAALSIGWLQDGLDYFVIAFPVAGTIVSAAITLTQGLETAALPANFILDYVNGILLDNDEGRLTRRGLDALLSYPKAVSAQGKPAVYAIAGTVGTGTLLYVRPIPNRTYNGTLYYYSFRPTLAATDIPVFPSDIALVRYVWLRGLEWSRSAPPGAAEEFASKLVAQLQKQGIVGEAEGDQISVDRKNFPGSPGSGVPGPWMGSSAPLGSPFGGGFFG